MPQFTVSVVEPLTPAELAVMVAVPVASPLAKPGVVIGGFTLVVGPMTATMVLLEVQVTKLVMSRVVLSENVPVAVNCCVEADRPSVGFVGATTSEVRVATVATGLTTTKSGLQPPGTVGQGFTGMLWTLANGVFVRSTRWTVLSLVPT